MVSRVSFQGLYGRVSLQGLQGLHGGGSKYHVTTTTVTLRRARLYAQRVKNAHCTILQMLLTAILDDLDNILIIRQPFDSVTFDLSLGAKSVEDDPPP